MNLKNYLRGLGIGITVTAIIMLIISRLNTLEISDEEIMQRAEALGMVEESATLSNLIASGENTNIVGDNDSTSDGDIANDNKNTETPTPGEDTVEVTIPMDTPVPTEIASATPEFVTPVPDDDSTKSDTDDNKKTPEPTVKPTDAPTAKPTEKPTETPTETPAEKPQSGGDTVRFTVNKGESSYDVAKNLFAAGFIDSASDFDTYLCEHNLDRYIYPGNYDIASNATYEEIGRILSGR